MNATDEIKLKAFLVALNGLEPSLPEVAYGSVHEMGVAIAQQDSDLVLAILEDLTQTYPHLGKRYEAVRLKLKRTYHAQERSKSVVATLEKTGIDLEQTAILLLTRFNPHTSALFTETSAPTKADVWEKSDRIAVMVAGGAFLGGTIGQIPGAIIGSFLAGLYGWYMGFGKAHPSGTP